MRKDEGHIIVEHKHRIWYQLLGEEGVPLLVLHGGPGAGHDYLNSLQKLSDKNPVVFYDQLGCGKSDIPDDVSLWSIDRFVDEVDIVRDALNLDQIHLLGHSWGGWLAIEYLLTRNTDGVKSLVLASTSASASQFISELSRLKRDLPETIYDAIQKHELNGSYEHPEYLEAIEFLYQRHFCRLEEWPPALQRTGDNIAASPVYETMWGKNEALCTGNLKHWNRAEYLTEISVPTLITVGKYDELTPNCAATLNQKIPESTLAVFQNSAHVPHIEEESKYLRTLSGFFSTIEAT